VSATVADVERFDRLYALGCVVSRLIDLNRWEPADIHHLVEGRKRLGHQATIPLSPWFHRGVPSRFDMRPSEATAALGPSLAINKRAFIERFGTERQLLDLTNELIQVTHDSTRMAAAIEAWRRRIGAERTNAFPWDDHQRDTVLSVHRQAEVSPDQRMAGQATEREGLQDEAANREG
jgi:hypothetical protein